MFNANVEQAFWGMEEAQPPTSEELEFLDNDMKKWVPNFPHLFRDKRILDLGAGRGLLGILLAQKHSPKLAVSLDLGFHRLRAAVGWLHQLGNFALVCGDAFQLPFPDRSFDY